MCTKCPSTIGSLGLPQPEFSSIEAQSLGLDSNTYHSFESMAMA